MSIQELVTFTLILGVAILSPGPAFLYMLKVSLQQGQAAGIRAGLGLGTMAAVWTLAALLGLDVVFALVPQLYFIVKTTGALYLIWLAVGLWRTAPDATATAPAKATSAFWGGVLINFGNPKSILFAASVILVVFPSPITLTHQIIVPAYHLLLESLFYCGFAALAATPRLRAAYDRATVAINRLAGVVMGAFGLRLLFDE